MRVLILNWKDLAHPLAGGAEVFTEEMGRALVERGHTVLDLGTHGESPIRGALLGSTPHKLLQLSERPVLVVPVGADI